MNIYLIKDHGIKKYTFPMFSQSEREMTRNLCHALENPDSLLRKFPRDYSIHLVGSLNQDTGEITPCEHQTIYPDLEDLLPTSRNTSQAEMQLDIDSPSLYRDAGESQQDYDERVQNSIRQIKGQQQ